MVRRAAAVLFLVLGWAAGAFAQSIPTCQIANNFSGAFQSTPGDYTVQVSPNARGTLRAVCGPPFTSYNWSPGNFQTQDIQVTAPGTSGSSVQYTLTGCNPVTFGCLPSVQITIQVAGGPFPPQGCTLTAQPNPVTLGNSTTLTAVCSGGDPATGYNFFSPTGALIQSGPNDTAVVTPTATGNQTYGVRAANAAGQSPLATVTVNVLPPPPSACTLTAAPNAIVLGAQSVVTAQCASGGAATTYTFTRPDGTQAAGPSNTLNVIPPSVGPYTVIMVASNAGGSAPASSVTITVQAAACVVTGSPANPVPRTTAVTLTAACNFQAASFQWSIAGAPAGPSSASITVTPAATTTYTLRATSVSTAVPVTATQDYTVVVTTADTIAIVGGSTLTGVPGRPLSRELQVLVTAGSAPVAGETVNWSVAPPTGPNPGTFASNPSPLTDAQGSTRNTFTMGTDPGGRTLVACLASLPARCVQFQVVPGGSAIFAIPGTPLVGAPGRPLSRSLQVRVTSDPQGTTPVAQELVSWSVVNPGASPGTFAAQTSAPTDVQGITTNTFTMGSDPGGRTLRACLVSLPAQCVDFVVRSLNAAVERPAAKIMSPMAELAVATPLAQLSNIRFRLDQLRLRRNPSVIEALRVSVAGHSLPSLSAFALAPLDKNGKAVPQKGGGAAADDPFERLGFFVNGDVEIGQQSATGVQNGYDLHTRGLTVGADYRLPGESVVGLAAGFMNANTDLAEAGGSQGARGYSFSAYGSFVPATGAYIDVIAHAGANKYDTRRREVTDAGLPVDYNSSTRGNQYAFAMSAGADFNRGPLTMNPYVRLDYVNATINRFSESGDDGAIQVGDLDLKTTVATVGGQLSYAISTSWGVLLPNARLELQRRLQGSGRNVSAQLVADGTVNAQVPLEAVDRDYGNVSVGFSAVLPRGISGFANYERLFGRDGYGNSKYTVGVRFEF